MFQKCIEYMFHNTAVFELLTGLILIIPIFSLIFDEEKN